MFEPVVATLITSMARTVTGAGSINRHRYHAATDRYGRQSSAARNIVAGAGRRFMPSSFCTARSSTAW